MDILRELGAELRRLRKKEKELRRKVERKGYSIKTIKGHAYVYTWRYVDGVCRWKYLGRLDEVELPQKDSPLEELLKVQEKRKRIEEVLRGLLE